MADESDKVSFLLDLDVAEFTEKGLQAKGIIEKLGSEESLSGLIEGLTVAAPILGALGVSAFAFKKAIDLTVEGEQIERVNNQFELLSQQAGIAPEKLKEGLEKASGGLISTNDLLKISNEAIVKMGGSADKLPQILEIARKATQVYGGDAKTNFEEITNAIANGNTRMLKHYGIIIDATKAEKDFADANGTTADQLSQAGKQQAILNAFLEKGNAGFKDVTLNAKSATSILQSLKTTFSEIGETFTLAFEKTIGPGMRKFLGTVQNLATQLKLHVQASIGDGAEAAKAKAILAGKSVDELTKKEEVATNKSIDNIKKVSQASIVDQEKQKKNQQTFRQEMSKIDQQYFKEQQQSVQSFAQIDQLVKKQTEMAERQHISNLKAIQSNASLDRKQKKQLEVMENKRFNEQMENDEKNSAALRLKLLDNYAKNSKTIFQGIERTFKANTQKMKMEQEDFGKRGTEMWNSLSVNATSAFESIGAGMVAQKDLGQNVASALAGFFLGFLGDRAIAEGTVMMLSGIWPPNPLALGGGAALIALGGALKAAGSAAGGASTPSTVATAPSPQAIASGSAAPIAPISSASTDTSQATPQATASMDQQQAPQRIVTVNISGNYLETDSTKRMLMDLMRQESDATGFNYNQIGA